MATQLPRPGVEVIQEFASASPTIVQPTLVPFITGVAKEVIEVTNSDGTVNKDSEQGTYDQLPQVISQSAFPSPRGNIAEVNVEEDSIRAFLLSGGSLGELTNEGFLASWNEARAASIASIEDTGAGFALDGKAIVLALDVPVSTDTSKDVTVSFSKAAGNLTAQEVVDAINAAVGVDVASIDNSGANPRVQIASTKFGAISSVTIRSGASGNAALFGSSTTEWRVEGAGFRAQDDNNNDTKSPWIEWFAGEYYENGAAVAWPTATASTIKAALIDESGVVAESKAPVVTFTGPGSIDLKAGDYFYADGVQVAGGEVERVEASRFRVGVINTKLSTYDSAGNLLTPVRDVVEVETLLSSTPFSPKHAWFQARNLTGNEVNTKAELTGSKTGNPAETAFVTGTADLAAANGPFTLTGLTLRVVVTVDGVVGPEQVITFTSSQADTAAIANVINASATDFTALVYSAGAGVENLRLSTVKTGKNQSITVKASGTANSILGFSAASDTTDVGKDVEFVDVPAVIQSSGNTFPEANIAIGNTIVISTSSDGGVTFPNTYTFTYSAAPAYADIASVISDLTNGTNGAWDVDPIAGGIITLSSSGNELVIKTVAVGSLAAIRISGTALSTTVGAMRFAQNQTDVGEENIAGQTFQFRLNDRPHTYEVVFTTDSLDDAVEVINDKVGFTVASKGGVGSDQLVLKSPLAGAASKVEVLTASTAKANAALGFGTGNTVATGTGRPERDMYVDVNGNAVIAAEILRNQVTGVPTDPGTAPLHIQYKGVRLDVSPLAKDPALLSIDTTTTLSSVLDPITSENPLALGLYFALLNAPGTSVKGMGVDEATAAAPEGTLTAFSRVANFIESEEVYAIAPLTHDETVISMFHTHAVAMSAADQKGERIVIVNQKVPDREVPTVVESGLSANTTATTNQLLLDVDPTSSLVANGLNPSSPFTPADNLYVEITVASGSTSEVRKYSVSTVSGPLVSFTTTFASGENDDGFYTTTPLTESLVNVDWSMKIRGAVLTIPGSTLPDLDRIAETVQKQASAYKSRRMVYTFPDTVVATLNGVDEQLPAYYACAAIAGMIAQQPPQQGFTNFPMTGFTGVIGSNDTFSNKQMNVMAAGGAYILVQDAPGAPLVSRHQLTTDLTTVETRELSITKVIDYTAKFLRAGLRNYIGTFNITQPFLDSLSSVIGGMLAFLVEAGVLVGADLNNIIQSETNPDTVLVDVTLDVPFPANYIRLTLVV